MRDSSKDVQLICDRDGLPSNDYGGHWYSFKVTPKMLPIAPGHSLCHYVPFAQLETEREVLRDVKREAAEIIAGLEKRLSALQEASMMVWMSRCGDGWARAAQLSALDDMKRLLP